MAKLLPHAAVLEGWHLGGSVYAEYLVLKTHQGASQYNITIYPSFCAFACSVLAWLFVENMHCPRRSLVS